MYQIFFVLINRHKREMNHEKFVSTLLCLQKCDLTLFLFRPLQIEYSIPYLFINSTIMLQITLATEHL